MKLKPVHLGILLVLGLLLLGFGDLQDIVGRLSGSNDFYAEAVVLYRDGSRKVYHIPNWGFDFQSLLDVSEDREIEAVSVLLLSNIELSDRFERLRYSGEVEIVVKTGMGSTHVVKTMQVDKTFTDVDVLRDVELVNITLTAEEIEQLISGIIAPGETFTLLFRIPARAIQVTVEDPRLSQPVVRTIPGEEKWVGITLYYSIPSDGSDGSGDPGNPPPSDPNPPGGGGGGGGWCRDCPVITSIDVFWRW